MTEEMRIVIKGFDDPTSPFYVEPEDFEKVSIDGLKYGLKIRDGILLPNFVRNLSMIKSLELRGDDTFILGFMKSGIHFRKQIPGFPCVL